MTQQKTTPADKSVEIAQTEKDEADVTAPEPDPQQTAEEILSQSTNLQEKIEQLGSQGILKKHNH